MVIDWDRELLGPINDEKGVEQGGTNSSDYYKIFGKEQLQLAHNSKLGVHMAGNVVVSAIGQADDTILISNEINALQNILQLTLYFCKKCHVDLCTEKTRLQAFSTSENQATVGNIKRYHLLKLMKKKYIL